MKPRLTHCGVAATLLVAATGLAGCGTADPSAAAVVDGHVIKEADMWSVIDDLGKVPRNAEVGVGDVLPTLIQSQVVLDHAQELKVPTASPETARLQLKSLIPAGQPEPNWSEATVKAFQDAASLGQVLNGPSQAKAVSLIQKADITVNPRYGTFDRQNLTLAAGNPNWMLPAATPSAQAPQPEQPQPGGAATTLPAPGGAPSGTATSGATPGAATPGTATPSAANPGAATGSGAAPTTAR